jgi:homogentisate 1,2-dioxygenase
MFESRYVIRPTKFAMETDALQKDYSDCWQGLKKNFDARELDSLLQPQLK